MRLLIGLLTKQLEMSVNFDYLNLQVGQSKSGLLCHVCNGGRTSEKTLSVSRTTTGYLWKCHRVSCAKSGISMEVGIAAATKNDSPANTPISSPCIRRNTYSDSLVSLPESAKGFIRSKWILTDWHIQVAGLQFMPGFPKGTSSAIGGRMWVPVRGFDGTSFGGVARSLDCTDGIGKTMGYYDRDLSYNLSYGPTGRDRTEGPVVLVEDQISALRASQYVLGVSLLGTSLTHSKLTKILSDTKTQVLNLCLDRDAVALAVEYSKKFSSLCDIVVHPMTKDLKDLGEDELQEYLLNMEK